MTSNTPILALRFAFLLAVAVFLVVSKNAVFAQQRYQAMSLSLLTELPERDGVASQTASQQKPKRGELKHADEARISPPFAFNRDDKYAAPDFEAFFPDDPEGGKQLDALFSGLLGGHHKPEDVLAAIRQGLRHTQVYHSQVLAQVGGFVWGVKQQNPQAIELLYHASDFRGPVSNEGMYYGLTVLKKHPLNVVRTLVNNYEQYGGQMQRRIGWGLETYGGSSQFSEKLDQLLEQSNKLGDNAVIAALELHEKAVGKRSPRIGSLANRGRFVVGFTHQDVQGDQELREHLERCVEAKMILSFVTRIDHGKHVGVCLLQGIGARDRMIEKLDADPRTELTFNETFSPMVLKVRQLRDLAEFLPNGLPSGAKPPYAPPPASESFAYNATDGYRPPDYENFFPNDEAAGRRLEELYKNRETTELTARQQLEIFRDGLKTANNGARMCGWVASIAGWPEDPLAKEIFYHAADPKSPDMLRRFAVDAGLSGNWDMPPNVLRLFAELIVTAPQDPRYANNRSSEIAGVLKTDHQKLAVAAHLDKALEQHENYLPDKLARLTAAYEQLTQRKPSSYEAYADKGDFFVAFSHNSNDLPAAVSEFCDEFFTGKPYFVRSVVGTVGKMRSTAFAIVSGHRGMTQCVEDLLKNKQLSIVFAGPLTLLDASPEWKATIQGETATTWTPEEYADAFGHLYRTLGSEYAHFDVKQIDWIAVGKELLPRSKMLKSGEEFCLLCQELVARLEDSHAYLMPGKLQPTSAPVPLFDPGFACLLDADGRPIVYHVDRQSSADQVGLTVGSVVTHVGEIEAGELLEQITKQTKRYSGYSSDRYLKYHAAQWIGRQREKGAPVRLRVITPGGDEAELRMVADQGVRYLPRLPVPIDDIQDSASVAWKRLDEETGYIYVRRIRNDLIAQLDAAVKELSDCEGLVIDVRGNSGGGFDAARSFRNFDLTDTAEPDRRRFSGPIAVLIDSRCISAGEGWASWFRANGRAKFFGTTTAGASSRKKTIDVLGGAYRVIYSVKPYRGFLDRPIERLGIEPDVVVHHTAESISQSKDQVLMAARRYLAKEKE
ncbi:S41 family peptidase [Neorhodopirellula pilleata]|uniref:Peptidase family S41 n=1 Tax=Neorhodopirellula pilleata TaxID=2714738 RepID=A0A5C6AWP5_9BACT|nr:S41 family peptidase [Neorhodopirellula pilleata]TWU04058.1 Peptidase family S41 [Neorhodopirellula pilleata]